MDLEGLRDNHELRQVHWSKCLEERAEQLGVPPALAASLITGARLQAIPGVLYHDHRHLISVAYDAAMLGEHEGLDEDKVRSLFLAGLFHDYGHTGVAKPDSVNIDVALEALRLYTPDLREASGGLISPEVLNDARNLISATNTDTFDRPLTRDWYRIIRDADLLGWAYEEFDAKAEALSEETGLKVTRESTREFLSAQNFYSDLTKDLLREAGLYTD